MKPEPQLAAPLVQIDSPSALIAATPPALGFVPAAEMVLWIVPEASDTASLIACPLADLGDAGLNRLVDVAVSHAAFTDSAPDGGAAAGDRRSRTGSTLQACLLAWVDCPDSALIDELPTHRVVGEFLWLAGESGLDVRAAITTNGRSWWSHMCTDKAGCCPATATALDEQRSLAVSAEFVGSGLVALPSRAALAELVGCDQPLAMSVMAGVPEVATPPAGSRTELMRWRRREIDWLCGWWTGQLGPSCWPDPAAPDLARALVGLQDVRVRDTVMLRMGMWGPRPTESPRDLQPLLSLLVRAADDSVVAPPATLLGVAAWLSGDGALASLALRRARLADPDYNLARLASLMLDSDLAPRVWVDGLRNLTEHECLTGEQDSANRRSRAQRVRAIRRLAG